MKYKVTTIVPVYNAERFLERGINCLLNQTLNDIKIICVNDASKDNCSEILDKLSKLNDRIVVINHDTNKGAGSARNTGLEYIFNLPVETEFISFFDADDQITEDAYEVAYNEAIKHDADILNFNFVPSTNWQYQTVVSGDSIDYKGNCLNAIFDNEEFYTFIVCWSKLYKKELLRDIRFNNGRFFEDGAFAYKVLSRAEKLRVIPNKFYIYNIENPESLSGKTSGQERSRAILRTIEETCEYWCKLGIFEKYKDKFEKHISLYSSLVCPDTYNQDKPIISNLIQGYDNCLKP